MRDVAALAGVSLKTVSRVVNREAGVSADVVARVERAVAQLGYRHNLAASNLRRGQRPHAPWSARCCRTSATRFSASLLRSLEDAARDRDVVIVASSLDEEPDRERALVEGLVRRRVDGLLLMPATDRQDYLADELRSGLPVVFVDRRPNGVDADSVTIDNALRLAARGRAPRRPTATGGSRCSATCRRSRRRRARLEGFRGGHGQGGHPADPKPASSDVAPIVRGRHRCGRVALLDSDDPPTAIFAARNSLAIGAIRALHQRGAARTRSPSSASTTSRSPTSSTRR